MKTKYLILVALVLSVIIIIESFYVEVTPLLIVMHGLLFLAVGVLIILYDELRQQTAVIKKKGDNEL